jgi:hypothetical protein
MDNSRIIRSRFIVILICALVSMIGFYLCFGMKSYPADVTASSSLVNGYVLQDTVPKKVYDYALKRIELWSNTQPKGKDKQYEIVDSKILIEDNAYVFYIREAGAKETDEDTSTEVIVDVKNLGNFYAISVTIDGELQRIY